MENTQSPWAKEMQAGDFISTTPSYPSGKYLDLFDEYTFPQIDKNVGDLKYYVFDPTKHGYDKNGKYPLLFALHGSGSSLFGKIVINHAAMEMFASPAYQQKMGGAYIVCPVANEYRKEGEPHTHDDFSTPLPGTGSLEGYSVELRAVMEKYFEEEPYYAMLMGSRNLYTNTLVALFNKVIAEYPAIGKRILFGTSAGGCGAWKLLLDDPMRFDAALIMAGAYLPSAREIATIKNPLWICHGQFDECVPFALTVAPNLEMYRTMPNVELFLPKFVYNGDHGISSINGGAPESPFEMGQHCINNAVHNDLLFDDGTPMDEMHPGGVTAWVKAQL